MLQRLPCVFVREDGRLVQAFAAIDVMACSSYIMIGHQKSVSDCLERASHCGFMLVLPFVILLRLLELRELRDKVENCCDLIKVENWVWMIW